jgi:hypothetical protein
MWLVGRLAADFKTLADFRSVNTAAIKNVCREFIVLCRRWRLFTESTVAIDGSKFKAVNHRDRNFTSAKKKTRMALIEESIAEYLMHLDIARRPGVADRLRCALDGPPGQGHRDRRLQRSDGR